MDLQGEGKDMDLQGEGKDMDLQGEGKDMDLQGEEFQPLSSPPRSSLRSGRSPTRSRGRVRGRVTFAQDCSSDYNTSDVSTPDPQDLQPHLQPHLQPYDAPVGSGQAPWTPPLETDPEPQDPVQAPKAWASECSHAHWPSLSSSLTQLLQPLASPPPRDTELDLEARTSRLLRLTSDDSTVLRRFSEGASRCQSPAPRSVSVDRLLNHQSPRLQQASRPQHGGSPQRQSMKQSCLDALTPPGPVDSTGQAAGSGLYSGLYSPPPLGSDLQTGTRYNSVSATQSSRPGLGDCHSVPRNPSPQPGVAELSSSLRGLLDLVDQHWAYDLLSALGSPPAAPCLRETEQKGDGQNRGGGEQSGSPADVTPQCIHDAVPLGLVGTPLVDGDEEALYCFVPMETVRLYPALVTPHNLLWLCDDLAVIECDSPLFRFIDWKDLAAGGVQ
ncbi:unnamed protein product [Coregonus sp. 'balchen']|nr:unnamed protein product [Coregonus sp. 'balchen']